MRRLLAALIVGLLSATVGAAGEVTLTTFDNVQIMGTYTEGAKNAPGVVLVHMLSRNRADWRAFTEALQKHGWHVLAIDLRGHGDSQDGPAGYRKFTDTEFQKTDYDISAAVKWLSNQPNVNSTGIAVVGASIGANAAVVRCARGSGVKTVALLSPGANFRGINAAESVESCRVPMFFVSAENDKSSSEATREMAGKAGGRGLLKIYPGKDHGTNLLTAHPELTDLLIDFLNKNY